MAGRVPATAPIGVCFSGGIDSGAVFLLASRPLARGDSPARLKAFTLDIRQRPELAASPRVLEALDLELFLEPIEADADVEDAIAVIEDYKPLDVQSAAMALALVPRHPRRYPEWTHLLDGDGGDENLKDYPIEDNPELTIRSVLNNPMLYQEGWGVHAQAFADLLRRPEPWYARTYAPLRKSGFTGLSPFTRPRVIEVAEGIPFADLTRGTSKGSTP